MAPIARATASDGEVAWRITEPTVGADGHIFKAVDFVLKDDGEAMEAAKQLADRHDVELCERTRKVAVSKCHATGQINANSIYRSLALPASSDSYEPAH